MKLQQMTNRYSWYIGIAAIAVTVAAASSTPSSTTSSSTSSSPSSSSQTHSWLNASQPIPDRVNALLAQMTLTEKICQLNHIFPSQMTWSSLPFPYNVSGVGAMTIESTPPPNATTCNMACRIANLRLFQDTLMNNTRLHLPVSFVIETSHSGAAGGTIFPMGATLGASWNTSLITSVFAAIAKEGRSWGGDTGLSPEINIVTDPRFGRTEENWGEDPHHVSKLATAAVLGIQGSSTLSPLDYLPNYSNTLIAQAKHAVAYGTGGYDGASADISPKTLHDVYLKSWRAFIEAGGRGMMLSHNELNSVQMHMNEEIMTTLFRNAYNYTGYYGSDDGNIDALVTAHVASNITQAAALAISAGMDMSFGGNAFSPDILEAAVSAGVISEVDITRACGNILTSKFAAGLFDGALPDPANRPFVYSDANKALAREAVQQSTILLENNNNLLPLKLAATTASTTNKNARRVMKEKGGGGGGGTEGEGEGGWQGKSRSGGTRKKMRASSSSSSSLSTVATPALDILSPLSSISKIAIIGPNAGCQPPPPPPPPGQCAFTQNADCDGDDVLKINNITNAATCCALCTNHSAQCNIAVLATDVNQCMLKSACTQAIPFANRIRIDVGRIPPPTNSPTPWTCQAQRAMLGGYSNLEQQFDALNDNHAHVFTLLEAAQNAANASGNAFQVTFAQGVDVTAIDESGIGAAVALAQEADVAIVVLGDSAEAVGYDSSVSCGEGADRPTLDLPGSQLDLLAALVATNTPIVAILVHGRPVTFGSDYGGSSISKFTINNTAPLNKRVGALLSAWRPGCEGGNGLWDILTGVVSPSGRLAQAWPQSAGATRLGGTSPWYQKFCSEECGGFTLNTPFAPLYPFGGGKDYLQVTYGTSQAVVDDASMTVNITVMVNNNDENMGGDKVVQVYFTQSVSRYTRYKRMLAGFQKVSLLPASSNVTVASIPILWKDLSYYDPISGNMVTEAGEYTFFICHSSAAAECPAANTHSIVIPATTTWI